MMVKDQVEKNEEKGFRQKDTALVTVTVSFLIDVKSRAKNVSISNSRDRHHVQLTNWVGRLASHSSVTKCDTTRFSPPTMPREIVTVQIGQCGNQGEYFGEMKHVLVVLMHRNSWICVLATIVRRTRHQQGRHPRRVRDRGRRSKGGVLLPSRRRTLHSEGDIDRSGTKSRCPRAPQLKQRAQRMEKVGDKQHLDLSLRKFVQPREHLRVQGWRRCWE